MVETQESYGGNYGKTISVGTLQRVLNKVALKIAEESKSHSSE